MSNLNFIKFKIMTLFIDFEKKIQRKETHVVVIKYVQDEFEIVFQCLLVKSSDESIFFIPK